MFPRESIGGSGPAQISCSGMRERDYLSFGYVVQVWIYDSATRFSGGGIGSEIGTGVLPST